MSILEVGQWKISGSRLTEQNVDKKWVDGIAN
jgi:hypothetical protein